MLHCYKRRPPTTLFRGGLGSTGSADRWKRLRKHLPSWLDSSPFHLVFVIHIISWIQSLKKMRHKTEADPLFFWDAAGWVLVKPRTFSWPHSSFTRLSCEVQGSQGCHGWQMRLHVSHYLVLSSSKETTKVNWWTSGSAFQLTIVQVTLTWDHPSIP